MEMKKLRRWLSLLLCAVMLCQPMLVSAEELVTNEQPIVTEDSAVAEEPEATEAPAATEAPEVTEAPAATEAPAETDAPVIEEVAAHFEAGYVSLNGAVVYENASLAKKTGTLTGTAYAESAKKADDVREDWLKLHFSAEGEVRTAYVQMKRVQVLTEAQIQALEAGAADDALRCGSHVLPAAEFKAAQEEPELPPENNDGILDRADALTIIEQPKSATVIDGETVEFTVVASGADLTYQWQRRISSDASWSSMYAKTFPTLSIVTTEHVNGFQFRCNVRDSNGGNVMTDVVTLTVLPEGTDVQLAITSQPVSAAAVAGSTVKFTVGANGIGLTYQWQYSADGGATWGKTSSTGSATATLSVSAVAARNGYLYRCVVTDATGASKTTNAVKLTVTEAAASVITITSHPANRTAEAGSTATFTVKATGESLAYQWQYSANNGTTWGNASSTGCKTATLSVSAVAARDGYLYRCKITDGSGQTVITRSATLTVVDEVESSIKITTNPTNKSVAIGKTVNFTVVATGDGLTYQWQYSADGGSTWGKTSSTGSATATITVTGAKARDGYLYRCKITDSNGQVAYSGSAKLTIAAAASTITITANPAAQTARVGETATFTVKATGTGLTYQWQYSADGGETWGNASSTGCKTATLSVSAVAARDGYLYRCKITDANGTSKTTSSAKLTVNPASTLKISIQPKDKTAAIGTIAKFTVTAKGEGLTYQWQYSKDGTNWGKASSDGSTTATLSVEAIAARNGYLYRCQIKDSNGDSVTSAAAKLVTYKKAAITTHPATVSVVVGKTATFKVVATGTGLTYQWQSRASSAGTWADISGKTASTLSVAATAALGGSQYRCKVKDTYGTVVYTYTATLKTYTAARITADPVGRTATVGDSVKFTITATGDVTAYQWQYSSDNGVTWGNASSTGAKTASITVEATKARDGYLYRCKVTDAGKTSIFSLSAKLTVKAPTPVTITTNPTACTATEGATAKFTVAATGEGLSYQWQFSRDGGTTWGSASSSGCKTASITVEATMARNGYLYRCKVTSTNGKVAYSASAKLTVKEKVIQSTASITSHPAARTVPNGETTTFTVVAKGEGLTYQWQFSRDNGATWGNASSTGAKTATITVEATTARNGYLYRCKVTDSSKASIYSNAAKLTTYAKLAITSQPASITVADGATATFKVAATGAGVTYQWQNRAGSGSSWNNMSSRTTATLSFTAATGLGGFQYRCKVTDRYGNSLYTDAAILTCYASAKITSHPVNQSVSNGATATFSVSATGSGLTYKWQYSANNGSTWGSASSTGYNTRTLSVEGTLGRDGYLYRCKVTDSFGNTVYSNAATLTVRNPLTITKHPVSGTVQEDESYYLSVTATGTGLSYQWQYRSGSSGSWYDWQGVTGNSVWVKGAVDQSGYQYRCKVTDTYGYTAYSNAATVTVTAKNTATITSHPANQTVASGASVTFSVTATGTGLTYQWQRRSSSSGTWGNISGATSRSHTMTASTSYNGYQYRCYVKDTYGNGVYSNAATLTVTTKVAITSHPASKTVYGGKSVTFSVTATGTGLTYQWQYRSSSTASWSNISGATSSSYTKVADLSASVENGQYRCYVRDTYGNGVYSNAATLTVEWPISITAHPASKTVSAGTSVTFSVTASSATGATLDYMWFSRKNSSATWEAIAGATSRTYTMTASASYNGYQYCCRVGDSNDFSSWSGDATLTVTAVSNPVTYRALLVGNTYPGTINALKGCDNDVNAMATMLGSMTGTKYTVSKRFNYNASSILSAISSTFSGADSNDVSLFYFSGHGTSSGQLVGTNNTYISPYKLRQALDAIPGTKIVLLDCCYSGAFINKSEDGEPSPAAFNSSVISAFSSVPKGTTDLATSGYYVLTACTKAQTSSTIELVSGHAFGAFTYGVCYGSGYDSWKLSWMSSMPADTNSNKAITLGEAYSVILNRVNYIDNIFIQQNMDPTGQSTQYYGSSSYVLWSK